MWTYEGCVDDVLLNQSHMNQPQPVWALGWNVMSVSKTSETPYPSTSSEETSKMPTLVKGMWCVSVQIWWTTLCKTFMIHYTEENCFSHHYSERGWSPPAAGSWSRVASPPKSGFSSVLRPSVIPPSLFLSFLSSAVSPLSPSRYKYSCDESQTFYRPFVLSPFSVLPPSSLSRLLMTSVSGCLTLSQFSARQQEEFPCRSLTVLAVNWLPPSGLRGTNPNLWADSPAKALKTNRMYVLEQWNQILLFFCFLFHWFIKQSLIDVTVKIVWRLIRLRVSSSLCSVRLSSLSCNDTPKKIVSVLSWLHGWCVCACAHTRFISSAWVHVV